MSRRAAQLITVVAAVLPFAISCTPSNRTTVVTLVTHSSPGGGSDVFLRSMAPHLSRIMNETMIVENVEGGSGALMLLASPFVDERKKSGLTKSHAAETASRCR